MIRAMVRRNLLFIAVFAGALFAGAIPSAKPEDAGMSSERLARIGDSIRRHVEAGDISGAVTMVSRRGRITHFEAHGLMDIESKKPMASNAIFRMASMSKPVTGVAILMLIEEGKIRPSDPVSKFIPEFKDMKVVVAKEGRPAQPGQTVPEPQFYLAPANREITIRDLLTHTSGLVSGGIGARQAAKLAPRGPNDTLADYIPRLAGVPLDFQPGTQWAYSGLAAFDTLGRVVEVVSGLAYDQFLKQRIFDPLGMKDTGFWQPEEKLARRVTLYRRTPQGLMKAENQNLLASAKYFSGAGGLMSTAEDYLQFAQMLVNGGVLNGKRLLSPRTVEWMASNHVGDMFNGKAGRPAHGMGFGLSVCVIEDAVAAGLRLSNGSFGWDGAFGTQVWIDPKEKMVSLLMIQTQVAEVQRDFENAVMQAIVE
ncbi:MAG: beta-lactamase family protein [Acidobacteria bacterium]|nr:beta-lactamase family protein [Acidobacteriota bacterium]